MIDFVNHIGEAVDSGDVAYRVLCDLSKAFYTINHQCLLKKLDHYGSREVPSLGFKATSLIVHSLYSGNRYPQDYSHF
jgi:hypothetical protein